MSIIKRIDNLGRLVLPKSIRKSLNISNNDEVELMIEGNQMIVKKYNLLEKNDKYLEDLIDSLSTILPEDVTAIITDTNIVLSASNLEYKGLKLTNKYLILLNSRKPFNEKIMPTFCPFTNLENIFLKDAYQILIDSNIYGSIAIVSKNYNYTVSKEVDAIVRFATEIIKKIM